MRSTCTHTPPSAATMTATADGSDRATDMTTTEARAETDQEKERGRETDLR